MAESNTALHYTPNDFATWQYAPASAGFNLADVSSKSTLDSLPSGVKGLVWLGMTNGADAAFQSAVSQFIGDPSLYGFYLADEPDPTQVSAANLKAESDWIHAHVPGAKTFVVLEDMGSPQSPDFTNNFTPANTGIDLYGIDPYPVRSQFTGGVDYSTITKGVAAAEAAGIPQSQIVPVYQAFGGGTYSSWTLPTAAQEQELLQVWGSAVPNPAFDYAYSWGVQGGDSAIENTPALQQVFAAHNAGNSSSGGAGGSSGGGSAGSGTSGGGTLTGKVELNAATEGVGIAAGTTIATFTDTNGSDTAAGFNAQINWGDGTISAGAVVGASGAFKVTGAHTYADEGSEPLSVAITRDADHATVTAAGTVTVDEADVLTGQGTTITGTANRTLSGVAVAKFTDSNLASIASDFTATISWGDGAISVGTVTGSDGTFTVTGSHLYAQAGPETLNVQLADKAPGTVSAAAISAAQISGGAQTGGGAGGSTGGGGTGADGAGTVISGSIVGPVVLPTVDSSLTVTSAGAITSSGSNDDGVDGAGSSPSAVTNFGKIVASDQGYGAGVWLPGGGTVVNGAGASISGTYGVEVSGGTGTVMNSGTLSGTEYAVLFLNSGSNRLVVNPTAVFNGAVQGGSGANTLELAGGTGSISDLSAGSGVVSQNGSWSFSAFDTIQVDAGGIWTLNGGDGVAVLNNGTIRTSGAVDLTGGIDPASIGVFQLASDSTLEVAAALGTQSTLAFVGSGTLAIDAVESFGAGVGTASYAGPQIRTFGIGDKIDLKDFGIAGAALRFDSATGIMQLTNAATQHASLRFDPASLTGGTFQVASDGNAGTILVRA